MRLVIEINYCTYECSGTLTCPIEYESAEQLLVDLGQFYINTKKSWQEYWRLRRSSVLGDFWSAVRPVDNFKGTGLSTSDFQCDMDSTPTYVAPDIYPLDEWFERCSLKVTGTTPSNSPTGTE